MNISDKIMMLRKERGLSQEELADMLDVTRQSVSKWESGQSIPDIAKIAQLSEIFGVSTDYLIKQTEGYEQDGGSARTNKIVPAMKLQDVADFMARTKATANKYVAGTVLCILSPLVLIVLNLSPAVNLLGGVFTQIIGICVLFALVSVAVGIFIYTHLKSSAHTDCGKLTGEVKVSVEKSKKTFVPVFAALMISGVTLCLLSTIPLIICALMSLEYMYIGLIVFFIIVTIAVGMFVWGGTVWHGYDRLLGMGDFSKAGRRRAKISQLVGSIYWPLVVVIYLASSFITEEWAKTWLIWPIAGLLFVVIEVVAEAIFVNVKNAEGDAKK